jgi:predicted ribosome quality control (RQC) complex YloA/Tae2 family protein
LSASRRRGWKAFCGEGPPRARGRAQAYRVYRTSGGLEVRVGRGAKDNDQLTFRHAGPEDV